MRPLIVLIIAASISGGTPAADQSAPDPVASVRAFAEQYLREAPSLVAREEYVQNATDRAGVGKRQVSTAELVMVRLPGAAGWISYRDVLTVDKRTNRQLQRLSAL